MHQEIDDPFVQIVAAQSRVAAGREDLEDAVVQLQDREVKRAATQVVNRNLRVVPKPVQTVGQRRGGRLVDDPFHGPTRQFARPFRRVALRIVEIRRHRDHGAVHRFSEKRLRVALQLFQNFRRNFLRRVIAAVDADGPGRGVAAP